MAFVDQLEHRRILLTASLEDAVVLVFALDRAVGRDGQHIQLVDVMELGGVRFSGAGHAAQFLIKTEVVLDGDRRERLGLLIDVNAFLGFHGLMQAIAPAATRHLTTGLFIDDDDLVVLDDVFVVLLV